MEPEITPVPGGDLLTRLGVKLYRYKAQLKRHWWVLLLTVSIGLVAESYLVWKEPVTHESVGSLMMSGKFNVGGGRWEEERSEFAGTQLRMLQSSEVHDRAARRLAIENPKLLGAVAISANIPQHTSIFYVSGIGTNRDYTQKYVDALMEEFLKYKREKMMDMADVATQQMAEGLGKMKKDIDERERNLHKFMEDNNMAFWEEESKTAAHYLSDLKTQQANLTTDLRRLQNLTTEELLTQPGSGTTRPPRNDDGGISSSNDSSTAQPVASTLAGDLNTQYIQTSQHLIQKKAELVEMSKIWKPKHPKLLAMQDDIADLQRLLETIKSQTKETGQSRISAIKAELKSLDVSIEGWEKKVKEASHKDAEYQQLQGGVKRAQDSYDKMQSEMLNLQAVRATEGGSLTINEHASPPREVSREILKHLLAGFALGFLAGSIILFVVDRADDRFSSSTEILEQFKDPILGQIPDVSNSRDKVGLPLLQPEDDRYVFAEAFRSLRSSLVFMPNQGELKSLLVTSSIPGEGKSTISSNLAITMAQAGAKVLLVDADLRRGDLAGFFDIDGRFGLTNVLRGEVKWQSVAHQTKYPTLTLIPRGPVTNQSGELLLVPSLENLLAELKENHDLVIFNTPPVLATDDTSTLAPHFDGTLMVVRAHFTSARMMRNTLSTLHQRQVNVLGLILNCIDVETPGYYYYRYPKYYAA